MNVHDKKNRKMTMANDFHAIVISRVFALEEKKNKTYISLSALLPFLTPSSLSAELALRLCGFAFFAELFLVLFVRLDLTFSSSDEFPEDVEDEESSDEELEDEDEVSAGAVATV